MTRDAVASRNGSYIEPSGRNTDGIHGISEDAVLFGPMLSPVTVDCKTGVWPL